MNTKGRIGDWPRGWENIRTTDQLPLPATWKQMRENAKKPKIQKFFSDQHPVTAQKKDVTKGRKILKDLDFYLNTGENMELRIRGSAETHQKAP